MHRSAGLAQPLPARWGRFALACLLALGSGLAGLFLAWNHPLWPLALSTAFVACVVWMAWRPAHLMLALPAGLPWLDFSPWTGRQAFSEFDLLVLACVAGAHARSVGGKPPLALRNAAVSSPHALVPWVVAIGLLISSLLALQRGVADAGGWTFTWWPGYTEATRAMVLFKPMLWLLLLLQPVRYLLRDAPAALFERFGLGMCLGAAVLVLAVLMERAAMPGLAEFSQPYRAVGLFWEMHVGGAAIDAYLAMTAPFVGWAVYRARTPLRFALASVLAVGFAHACLITFSRGVYGAVLLPLMAMGLLLWAREGGSTRPGVELFRAAAVVAVAVLLVVLAFTLAGAGAAAAGLLLAAGAAWLAQRHWPQALGWRRLAGRGLAVALVLEVLAVVWLGSFLADRVQQSQRDFGRRLEHWGQGLALVKDPADRWLGIGLGRLPPHLARFARRHEFSGAVALGQAEAGRAKVRLSGPATWADLAGLFSLTQRVALTAGPYRVEFDVRAAQPFELALTVCELHLLYERRCQGRWLQVPAAAHWQHMAAELQGPPLALGPWWAPRQAVFLVSVVNVAAAVELTGFRLGAPGHPMLLRNGDFGEGLDHWLPLAQTYFLPWHIDNLYLELLLERGPMALLAFLLLTACALARLARRSAGVSPAQFEIRLTVGAALSGLLLVGAVSSVMDTGRTAFLALGIVSMATALAWPPAAGTRTHAA